MTLDTIFDLASLTKVVATTTAVMRLVEKGRFGSTTVASYVPGFERYGKDRHHDPPPADHMSGLRPDFELSVSSRARGKRFDVPSRKSPSPHLATGSSTPTSTSSCSGISSRAERRAARRLHGATIFAPLRMSDTAFLPAARAAADCAHGSVRAPCMAVRPPGAPMLRGSCTIRPRGGWEASPGTPVFSRPATTLELRAHAVAGGTWHGARILSPLRVAWMTGAATADDDRAARPGVGHRHGVLGESRGLFPIGRSATRDSRARRSGSIR